MSKEKRTIEITPGLMSPGGSMKECFLSRGHVCTYCQGTTATTGRKTAIVNATSKDALFVKAADVLMRQW